MTAAILHDGLRPARARLHRDHIATAWRHGVARASVTLAVVASIAAGIALVGHGSASHALTLTLWGIGGVVILAVLLDGPWRAWRRPPTDADTAERVDLAAGTRNRIATALDLAASDSDSPYAAAAIASGIDALRAHAATRPARPHAPSRIRVSAVALTIAALLMFVATLPWSAPVALSLAPTPSGGPSAAAVVSSTTQSASPAAPPPAARSTAVPTAGGRGVASAGALSRQPTAGQSTAGTGAATDATVAAAAPPAPTPATPPSASTPTPKSDTARAQPAGSSGSGPGSASAAGRGGTRQQSPAVPGDWPSHEQIADAPDADTDAAAVPPDPAAADAHVGALQPLLQDRAPAASRELGIGSPKDGPGGNGRGGPSLQKKARGVAALLMAVPLPQHLRARLLAGTSRTGEAFAPPTAGSLPPAAATPTPPCQGDEPPVRTDAAPSDQADLLARYFAALHSDAQPDAIRP